MAALNWDLFDQAVLTALRAGTGLKDSHVILAFQAGPRPTAGLYVEANTRFSVGRQGMRDEEKADAATPGQLIRTVRRDITVSCRTIGAGANALGELVVEYLQTETGRALLALSNITVRDPGSTKNLTELLDTDWLEEASLDFVLSASGTATDVVGWIQDVGVRGVFTKPDGGTVDYSDTIGP